jgi:hypothetical protein
MSRTGRMGWAGGLAASAVAAAPSAWLWVLLVSNAPDPTVRASLDRSFRAGLWACAWAVVLDMPLLVAAWLAEALAWHRQRGQLLLDGEGGFGLGASLVGANLGDAIWWTLVTLALWALPMGVLGAVARSRRARRRRARERAGLVPSS